MGTISCHSNQSSYPTGTKKTQLFVPPTYRCYMCNMKRIVLTASEEMSFENVDRRRTTDASFGSGELIIRHKCIGYNLNIMRQSACLVINPITIDNFAASFNCTPVDRVADSVMAPT